MNVKLDTSDEQILTELLKNADRSMMEIAEELKMRRTTVLDRIRKLKAAGIIKGFTIIPDYAKLGFDITAFIFLTMTPIPGVNDREIARKVSNLEEVVEAHIITGDWDMILEVRARTMQEIASFAMDRLRSVEGVGKTMTCISSVPIKEHSNSIIHSKR
jgi:Lrp/AsnC family transcriptional regulator for asnA, asnC and gidA